VKDTGILLVSYAENALRTTINSSICGREYLGSYSGEMGANGYLEISMVVDTDSRGQSWLVEAF